MQLTDEIFKGTVQYHKKFAKICEPMQRYFGINAITYINMNNRGELINLHTHIPWMERCMEQHYYQCDPGMVSPKNIASGFTLDETYGQSEYTDIMMQDCFDTFDLCYECTYVEKNKNSYQLFAFNAPKKNTRFISRVISEFKILKQFIRQIQHSLYNNRHEVESFQYDFANIKGPIFYEQQGIISINQAENERKIRILQDIGMAKNNLSTVSFSNQEKNCLRLYTEGNTMKQIAISMDISDKTVSKYLENVKNKLNCSTKNELVRQAEILESLGIL